MSYIRIGTGCFSVHRTRALNRRTRGKTVATPHFLVHSPKDNVGVVVVEGLRAGTDMLGHVNDTDKTHKLTAPADIPIGHKVALKTLKKGDTVIKYGEDIGKMVADADTG